MVKTGQGRGGLIRRKSSRCRLIPLPGSRCNTGSEMVRFWNQADGRPRLTPPGIPVMKCSTVKSPPYRYGASVPTELTRMAWVVTMKLPADSVMISGRL